MKARINLNKAIYQTFVFVFLLITMILFYFIGAIPPLIFMWFICLVYLTAIPRYLFSPKNIIFAYYFLWYALAPAFAKNFQFYSFTTFEEKIAYLMLFITYGISMVTISFCEDYFVNKAKLKKNSFEVCDLKKIAVISKISVVIVIVSLFIYISKTGGIERWLIDSGMAFIGREGAGGIYLVFLHSLMIFSLSYGIMAFKKYKKASLFKLFIIIIILFPFVGSKGQVILIAFIGLSPYLLNMKLTLKWTIRIVLVVGIIFSIGIYQRNYTWMTFTDFIPYSLNYFNTYEMLVILIRDFPPSFFKTVFLPLNWLLLKFGTYVNVPFHDMSIWLTSIYFPLDYMVDATQQWPIEADLYMSFYYFFGIPFLVLYLIWISFLFSKALKGYLSWILIYVVEFVYMLSHYRGGLLTYWYFWLIPFYILVLWIFKKMKIDNTSFEKLY